MAPSAVMDDDNLLLLSLLAGCHFRVIVSILYDADWGMRAIQGSFPRLKDRFIFSGDPRDRQLFMHLIPLLLNFRTNFVGLNQLQSTFYPDFEHWGDNVYDMF